MRYFSLFILLGSVAAHAGGPRLINGYIKANGTYVAPYVRSAPDNTVYNNFSYSPRTTYTPPTTDEPLKSIVMPLADDDTDEENDE